MAIGPRLNVIAGGGAIIADTLMQNFEAIVDFLRAIPSDNLLSPYYTWTQAALFGNVAAASTVYNGYRRVSFGQAPVQLEHVAVIELANVIVNPATVTVTWQKCTPANGSFPRFADAWTDLTNSIVFNAAGTVVGSDDIAGDPAAKPPYRYGSRATLTGTPALADGDWIRCKIVTTAAIPAMTAAECSLTLKGLLRQ